MRFFAFYLANGTVDVELLDGIDYRPHLVQFGSELEMAFTIFMNVLQVDDQGRVTNEGVAHRRAAQWIRSNCDPIYVVEPPFAEWETELA